jgi:hypothetical protein
MNVNTFLNNTLSLVTLNMHKTRFQALSACLHSLLHGGAASVTGMGRGIDSKAYEEITLNGPTGFAPIHIY